MQKDSKGRFHSYFELVSFLTTVRKVRLQASFVRHCPMTDNYLQPWVWSGPLVTGRRSRLLFFKTFHWHRSRSLCSLRKQPFLLATRPAAMTETAPPPLISGSGWPAPLPPTPYLKVWFRHCIVLATQWWEHLPPTNEAWVKIPKPTPYMGWVVACSFPCSERFFSGYSCFRLPSKPAFSDYNSIWNTRFNEFLGTFHSTKIPVWNLGNFACPMERYI